MRVKTIIKFIYFITAILIIPTLVSVHQTSASSCPDLRLVFARGSGGERWNDQNYLAFKSTIESKLQTTSLEYEFIDLDYPAVGIGIDKLKITLGALFGSGDAYEFGESINTGVHNLEQLINSPGCPSTQYVLGGYSQGAMVISKSLHNINADHIIYAATFGDPKIYLPEGNGPFPPACRGENLSDYRMYVPDCHAHKGLLGAYQPYEPEKFIGKVGTWCNNRDIFCSSKHFNPGNIMDHTSYIKDELYTDASKVIFDKIAKNFNLENKFSSPHDTVFLIDSTSSMEQLIVQYKTEAMRLATKTIESGGRIALFDYRDLSDPYELKKHCSFEDCTLSKFQEELNSIEVANGGDVPESLLSASFHAMQALNWKQGSTKSVVVLTDANFISPDLDGTTMDDVVELSKRIDPVNFYFITAPEYIGEYAYLASVTDGKVVSIHDKLDLLTDYIIERYDSLPKVEENQAPPELPVIETISVNYKDQNTAILRFTNTGTNTIVVLNDQILGLTENTEITITDLDRIKPNIIALVPLDSGIRGEPTMVELDTIKDYEASNVTKNQSNSRSTLDISIIIPKAPNTGQN